MVAFHWLHHEMVHASALHVNCLRITTFSMGKAARRGASLTMWRLRFLPFRKSMIHNDTSVSLMCHCR